MHYPPALTAAQARAQREVRRTYRRTDEHALGSKSVRQAVRAERHATRRALRLVASS